MEAWLIYFRENAMYNKQFIQSFIDEGKKLHLYIRLILVEDLEFGVKNNQWFLNYQNREIQKPDFVICRAIYPLLSRQLELMGIRVFNNSFVSELCNDKAKTYQYLSKTGITMVDSSFYKNPLIEEVLERVGPNTVIKAVDGHGGSQVFLTESSVSGPLKQSDSYDKNLIINGLKSSDVVIQPLTGNRHQDLRVYVVGDKIIASVLRTSREGFRSNFSLGGEVSLYFLTEEEKSIVETIIKQFTFDFVGIDFIIGDDGELIFNEIEDVVGSRMLYQCSNINIVEVYLKYILDTF